MSYRISWANAFFADEFHVEDVPPGAHAPEIDSDHVDPTTGRPLCFKAVDAAIDPTSLSGNWKLNTKLNVPIIMPGTNQKLLRISVDGLYLIDWGTIIATLEHKLHLYGDGVRLFSSTPLIEGNNEWRTNRFDLNVPIDAVTELDVWLEQVISLWSGRYEMHERGIVLEGEYYSSTPPATASVRIDVKNKDTGAGISRAYVALMSGAVIEADGYTDGGTITFNNVTEGSYALRVRADGFHPLETAIDVTAPSVWYTANLTPVPSVPLPWWVMPLAAGTALIGGVVVIGSIAKRKRAPVYVVK